MYDEGVYDGGSWGCMMGECMMGGSWGGSRSAPHIKAVSCVSGRVDDNVSIVFSC